MASSKAKKVRLSTLEERGWNRDLCNIYLPGQTGWYVLEDAVAAEKTEAWQHDAKRASNGEILTLRRQDLEERGWTRAMVKTFLGDPPIVIKLNASGTRVLHLFLSKEVESIEKTSEFQARKEKSQNRREAGRAVAELRRQEVLDAAREYAAQLEIVAPANRRALKREALHHQAELAEMRGYDFTPDGADQATIDRWCRNYLRHACSNYDAMLEEMQWRFKGQPGVWDIYGEIVRPRVDAMVEEVIADL